MLSAALKVAAGSSKLQDALSVDALVTSAREKDAALYEVLEVCMKQGGDAPLGEAGSLLELRALELDRFVRGGVVEAMFRGGEVAR